MCARRVNLFVYSLSLHRHSYVGFIITFASSIHNNKPDPLVLINSETSDPTLNGRLHCNDIDKSLNELLMTRSVNIVWTIITTLLTLSCLCRLLLVRMDVYIVTLSDFYSYRFIGKLTAFFAASGFSQSNLGSTYFHFRHTVVLNHLSAHCCPESSQNVDCYSQRILFYVLPSI